MVTVGLRSLWWCPWSLVVSSGLRGLSQSPVIFSGLRWSTMFSVGLRSLRWSPEVSGGLLWSPVVFDGLRGSP